MGQGHGCDNGAGSKAVGWFAAIVGTVYGIWLLYASGWEYLLITTLCYAPGTILYIWAKKEKREKIFGQRVDVISFALVMVLFVISLIMLATGAIQPF